MKALFLATHTPDCEKIWRSWEAIGNEAPVIVYDEIPHDRHDDLIGWAKMMEPDLIVFIGAIEEFHGRPVPTPDTLRRLRDVAPTVHVCSDGCEEVWWEWLRLYDERGCFNVQISIDGSFNTPLADELPSGMVRLTPTDPRVFVPVPWAVKSIAAGMAGGIGHGARAELIRGLGRDLTWLDAASGAPYAEMCRFMSDCRLVVNSPVNGSGSTVHVKGRVVETGWAGACLLERRDSPTAEWFDPRTEYLEYVDVGNAREVIAWARKNDAAVEAMAARFAYRMEAEHHPSVFWGDVLARI